MAKSRRMEELVSVPMASSVPSVYGLYSVRTPHTISDTSWRKSQKAVRKLSMVSKFRGWQYDDNNIDGKRARPYETVKPLAWDLDLEVDISCERNDYKCVQDAVKSHDGKGNILICWEHHRITNIIQKLRDHDAPIYPDDRWVLMKCHEPHWSLIWHE